MANEHVQEVLSSHREEIAGYLKQGHAELLALDERRDELRSSLQKAERDLSRAERAHSAIRGDDEPQSGTSAARGFGDELDRAGTKGSVFR